MTRWEYKVVVLPKEAFLSNKYDEIEAFLNKLGAQGWGIIQCESAVVILKREKANAKT